MKELKEIDIWSAKISGNIEVVVGLDNLEVIRIDASRMERFFIITFLKPIVFTCFEFYF